MKNKIGEVFLLLLIFIFLFSLISCNNKDDQLRIAELEKQLDECQGEKLIEEESTTEKNEEESLQEETTESSIEKVRKNFAPVVEKDFFIQGNTTCIFILDGYLYTAGQGLNIFDITEKTDPKLASSIINSDWISKLYVEDNYAYVIYYGWNNETNSQVSGFKIIDVNNKEKPEEMADFKMDTDSNIYNVAILGNYAFISYSFYGQEPESGIKILDITDKANPVFMEDVAIEKYGGGPLCITNQLGYFFSNGVLKVIDLKDIINISEVENNPLYIYANEILVKDNYLYFTTENTLQIIDLTNNLEIIGGVFGRGRSQGMAVKDDYACLTYIIGYSDDQTWTIKESGLQIIDLSDKSQSSIVSRIDISGEASGVFIEDNYAYVAAGSNGLQIVKLFDK